jgi:hypothetical protein
LKNQLQLFGGLAFDGGRVFCRGLWPGYRFAFRWLGRYWTQQCILGIRREIKPKLKNSVAKNEKRRKLLTKN